MITGSNTWIIYCMGDSIKGKVDKIKEHFKDCKNTIAVNKAILYFPSKYWAMLDSQPYEWCPDYRKNNIITSCSNYERVLRADKNLEIYEKCELSASNSGTFAMLYAVSKGAKNIITCGIDMKDGWEYFDNSDNSHQHQNYVQLVRNEFRTYSKQAKKYCNIYSLDKDNILDLEFYDIGD